MKDGLSCQTIINPKFLLRIVFFVGCVISSKSFSAVGELKTLPNLKIQIISLVESDPIQELKKSKSNTKKMQQMCLNLANSLSVGKGPWGIGLFNQISCSVDNETISGVDVNEFWLMKIELLKGGGTVQLSSNDVYENQEVIRKFENVPNFMDLFQSSKFVDILAIRLLNEFPFMGVIQKEKINSNSEFEKRGAFYPDAKKQFLPPPSLLGFYSRRFGRWQMPEIIGRIVYKSLNGISRSINNFETVKPDVPIVEEEFHLIWRLDKKFQSANWDQIVWFQDERGYGKLVAEADQILNEYAHQFLLDAKDGFGSSVNKNIQSIFKAPSFELKVGAQAYTNDSVVKNRKFVKIICSLEDGLWKNWQYSYEKNPKTTVDALGASQGLELSKHIVTRSLQFGEKDASGFFQMHPQMGLFALKSSIIDAFDAEGNGESTRELVVSRGYLFGLHGRLMFRAKKFWLVPSLGYQLVDNFDANNSIRYTNMDFGVDAFYKAMSKLLNISSIEGYLVGAFFLYERTNLTASDRTDSQEEATGNLNAWSFSSGIAGVKVGVFW